MMDGGDRDTDDDGIPPARQTTVSKIEHGSEDKDAMNGSGQRREHKDSPHSDRSRDQRGDND